MSFHWPYYTLRNGRLYDERGRLVRSPVFPDAASAEAWLVANDLRGNVRD